MDAKERHELKDNDLAEFLENFGAFWNKHGNSVSLVILIGVAAWFGYRYYQSYTLTQHETAWSDLAATVTPQGYRERAKENAGDVGIANLALLQGAEAFHQQALKLGDEEVDAASGLMSAKDNLDNAEAMYKQVLDSDIDDVYRANAAVGLANVAETRGDFDAARQYWTQALQVAEGAKLKAIVAQAKVRLEMLDELAKPIVFADSTLSTAPIADTPAEAPAQVESPAVEPTAPADPG